MSRNVALANYVLTMLGFLTGGLLFLSVPLGMIGWLGTRGHWLSWHFARHVSTPLYGLFALFLWMLVVMFLFLGGVAGKSTATIVFTAPIFYLGFIVIYAVMWVRIVGGMIRLFKDDVETDETPRITSEKSTTATDPE